MKRVTFLMTLIFSFALFTGAFSAAGISYPVSEDAFAESVREASDGEIFFVSDMDMSGAVSVAVTKNAVIRARGKTPVTFGGAVFVLCGNGVEPIKVCFENIVFDALGREGVSAVTVSGNVNAVFVNCTFRGYSADKGSALFLSSNDASESCSVTFTNCLFENGRAKEGGAVFAESDLGNVSVKMSGCVFSSNVSDLGGAAFFSGVSATLSGCTFSGNDASVWGGGIYAKEGSLTLSNCLFNGNFAFYGGAVASERTKLTVTDSIFADNVAKRHGGGLWVVCTDETEIPDYDPFLQDEPSPVLLNYIKISYSSVYCNSASQCGGLCLCDSLDVGRAEFALSTFAYNGAVEDAPYEEYAEPFRERSDVDIFGCILEGDGYEYALPTEDNGYSLTFDAAEKEFFIAGEQILSAPYIHLECTSELEELRIPTEAVRERFSSSYSYIYGSFPVGDNSGTVTLKFRYYPLRTATLSLNRGSYLSRIPAPERDMYSFQGWYFDNGDKLPGYKLLVGGDTDVIEFESSWNLSSKAYVTGAGVIFFVACCAVGAVIVKRRMKKVDGE